MSPEPTSPKLGSMNETCPGLAKHLQAEERALRADTFSNVLNGELIERSKEAKRLVEEVHKVHTHEDAVSNGLVKEVLAALHGTHRMSVQLTTWLGTFTPPLSVGGNAGVSAEVQDGIYSNMQQLVQTCSDGLHRMLAFEKERAMMRLKCLEEKGGSEEARESVWRRYESALEENQLHELRKTCLTLNADLLCVAHTLKNNGEHLTTHSNQNLTMF
mmetsp:Transcript_2627/g.6891  ORF Transcript_2627/g.6891 Transcript_2627/m.6891 type:complete len:216 (+) Transcript_2627:229-876(+)